MSLFQFSAMQRMVCFCSKEWGTTNYAVNYISLFARSIYVRVVCYRSTLCFKQIKTKSLVTNKSFYYILHLIYRRQV
jgi:hypothetical protein